jgi:hypothetical protein
MVEGEGSKADSGRCWDIGMGGRYKVKGERIKVKG